MSETVTPKYPGQLNSVQLNLVTFVDVAGAARARTLDGYAYMRDNSVDSKNQATARLQTTCKQGQILNWIILAMDSEKKANGEWPPMPKIRNIVFLNRDGSNVAEHNVCTQFEVYGGPDRIYSRWTPVYYYWAGTVLPELAPGIYDYRLVVELPVEQPSLCLNLGELKDGEYDGPALNVIPMNSDPPLG